MNSQERNGTHLPSLLRAILLSDGPIVEFGMGLSSSPFIALARGDREVFHYDNDPEWMDRALITAYPNGRPRDTHVIPVRDWTQQTPFPCGVLFVDQWPAETRGPSLIPWINYVKIFVCHDWEDPNACGWQVAETALRGAGYLPEIDTTLVPNTALWRQYD